MLISKIWGEIIMKNPMSKYADHVSELIIQRSTVTKELTSHFYSFKWEVIKVKHTWLFLFGNIIILN